jgi:hypothetical protein
MNYDPANYTWGMEIEWGDIPRSFNIPEHLGTWEYSERDIINTLPPYKNISADPLGLEPPVGGEINTKPTKTWQEQVDRYFELKQMFEDAGHTPTVCCTNHTHLHCFIPGLKEDITALKKFIAYVKENQKTAIDAAYMYYDVAEMKEVKGAKNYLKWDGGRYMPDYMCDNIINLATDFDSFIKLHAAGKDGVSMGRPFRYGINTYSMKHIGTIEFRFYRGTLVREEIEACFKFTSDFIAAALNDGPSAYDLLRENKYKFPPMIWELDQMKGWEKTKHGEDRGKKVRTFHEVA